MRRIRWIGHPSPLDDQNVRRLLDAGKLDPAIALAFQKFEHNRRISVRRGASVFTIGPEQGFSRRYQWGPLHFDVEMDDSDWQKLARNPVDRHMMLDITAGAPLLRPGMTQAEWRELLQAAEKTPAPAVAMAR